MTVTISPIPTRYAGCHFRSRLEARWAVFFDALGIQWEYEPQGFEVGWPEHRRRYLPDFYLPREHLWVEVKGTDAALDRSLLLAAVAPDVGLPLDPGGAPFEGEFITGYVDRLLLLGPIHRSGVKGRLHPLLSWHGRAALRMWGMFRSKPDPGVGPGLLRRLPGRPPNLFGSVLRNVTDVTLLGENGWVDHNPAHAGDWPVIGAYDLARSARFEHGQSGPDVRGHDAKAGRPRPRA